MILGRALGCARDGRMALQSWSTAAAREGERFGYWHDAVCRAVLNVDTENPPEHGFFGEISAVPRAGARFVRFASAAHRIVRSPRLARRAEDGHVLVSLQLAGSSRIRQGGADLAVAPGEIAILDGACPFEIEFPAKVGRMIAVIPRVRLAARTPWRMPAQACKLAGDGWSADLIARTLAVLADPQIDPGADGAEALFDSLAGLLALAQQPGRGAAAAPGALQGEAMAAFVRRHACEPGLDAAAIAARFGVSIRTVHGRFAARGTTLGRALLDHRLDLARGALESAAWRGAPVSQIAWACGFCDLSHFTKSFRRRFGVAPREWRAGLRLGGQIGPAKAE